MLADGKMMGFIPVTDYDAARAFYEGKLGMEFVSLDNFAMVMSIGGHHVRIVKMPGFEPIQATILGWEVADVRATAKWLIGRGVAFEKYPWVQDAEGVWDAPGGTQVAWFKDPAGNVLSISTH